MFSIALSILLINQNPLTDLEVAKEAYNKGNYQIAEVYFENFLRENPSNKSVPEAIYYLIKVYDRKGKFIDFLDMVNRYLKIHKFGAKSEEVFSLLLGRLLERQNYSLAADYIKRYKYLITDAKILEPIFVGLCRQKKFTPALTILPLCPQSDTIKILLAQLQSDQKAKKDIYKSISGLKGKIYLMENCLANGDTVNAYEIYKGIDKKDIGNDLLYRFTKIGIIFERQDCAGLIKRLKQIKEFSNKAKILQGLTTGELAEKIIPQDGEEFYLLSQFLAIDTIATLPPDTIIPDSLFIDTVAMIGLIGKNYYLDSVYSEIFVSLNKYARAYKIMMNYLPYLNTRHYVRKLRALKYFDEGKYQLALNDIILSGNKEPKIRFLLAECYKKIGRCQSKLYLDVMRETTDSLLYFRSLKNFVKCEFADKNYKNIIKYKIEDFQQDTNLIKIYLKSLAHLGKKEHADSLFDEIFSEIDFEYLNSYGEYLIEKEFYTRAANYYDSIIQDSVNNIPGKIYFNWALIPFLRGNIDSAEHRFKYHIKNFRNTREYPFSLFKIATMKYLKDDFDSAAYYYGLSSRDSLLRCDALQNQLICYKKGEMWQAVLEVGNKIIPLCSNDEEKSDVFFNIGYAHLRSGNFRAAIKNLKDAINLKSTAEYHYWLGEAYLSKGDFKGALYQYQKIVNSFPGDKMWTPTAQFKTGLALEFMDGAQAAKKVYQRIIRIRGLGDVWGAEAQKRLEMLK